MVAAAERAWRSPLAARVDDGADTLEVPPHVDRHATIEQLEAATVAARQKARADSEGEWTKPLSSAATVREASR
jgi:hypothetical protein